MIKITPVDLLQHEFSRRLRGLDPEEVQNFLKDIAEEIEELVRENAAQAEKLRQQAQEIGQFQEKEATLRDTMITAQKLSEQIKESAEREAHLITREAEIRAKKIFEEVQGRLSQVEADITELKRQRSNLRAKIRSALQAHQELLAYTLEEEPEQKSSKGDKK
jgi:cell division initiation protein